MYFVPVLDLVSDLIYLMLLILDFIHHLYSSTGFEQKLNNRTDYQFLMDNMDHILDKMSYCPLTT